MTGARRRQMARPIGAPDPRELRRRQLVAALIIGAAVVGVLVIGVILFGGGSAPKPTPSPAAVGSNRPTGPASASASAPVSRSPVATSSVVPPTATPTAAASLTPGVTGLPSASGGGPLGEGIARDATFSLLGIDDQAAPEAIPRRITFNVDGAGDIEADLSDLTAGTVRMCLYPSDGTTDPTDADCTVTDAGSIVRTPTVSGPWTVWLFGDEPGRSPSGTLRIRWYATTAALQLTDFRFQGADSPNYTGFRVRVVPEVDGQLTINATWDDGQGGDYPYLIVLTDLDGSGEPPIFQGENDHADGSRPVTAGRHYEAAIDDTQESVVNQVLLRAVVSWP